MTIMSSCPQTIGFYPEQRSCEPIFYKQGYGLLRIRETNIFVGLARECSLELRANFQKLPVKSEATGQSPSTLLGPH